MAFCNLEAPSSVQPDTTQTSMRTAHERCGELNELMTAGRLRETGAVLAAAGATPTGLPDGDPLAGWHAWGGAIQVAAGAAADWAAERHVADGAIQGNGHAGSSPSGRDERKGEPQ